MTEESLRQYIIALENENAILKGRQMALYAILADLRTSLTEHHDANARRSAVALLKATIRELEGAQDNG